MKLPSIPRLGLRVLVAAVALGFIVDTLFPPPSFRELLVFVAGGVFVVASFAVIKNRFEVSPERLLRVAGILAVLTAFSALTQQSPSDDVFSAGTYVLLVAMTILTGVICFARR